jgi:hypothetical protein
MFRPFFHSRGQSRPDRLSYRDADPRLLSGRVTHVRSQVLDDRPPLTAEDLRIHAWINERLAVLRRERQGLWAKVRWLLVLGTVLVVLVVLTWILSVP